LETVKMAQRIELDAAKAKVAAERLHESGNDLGDVLRMLQEGIDQYMNPSCAGTDDIGAGFNKNCGQLMDNLVQTLAGHHKSIVGSDGLAAAFVTSTAALGKTDQASADAFNAAAKTLGA